MKRLLIFLLLIGILLPLSTLTAHALLTQAVNNLATQCEVVKSAKPGEDVVFTDADFRQALGVETYPDLTILSLPDPQTGVLKLDKLRVSVGQVIPRMSVERLLFTPSNEAVQGASFTFRAGNLSGGAALTCTIRYTERANHAPTVNGGAVTAFSTKKNASLWGTMACYDPDGDALCYLVVDYPKHGTLTITDAASGAFRYTPTAGYSGSDSFTYVVRDAYGDYSPVGKVKILVEKKARDFTITDMSDDAAAHAALRMVNANIMQVEHNGYAVYFHPAGTMTRAEFLVAAMRACGVSAEEGRAWAYDDLDAIPASAVPYVSSATAAGYVTPTWEGGLYFRPAEEITYAEAIAWVSAICGGCPAGISSEAATTDEVLTRKDAAWILYAASLTQE